MGIIQKDAVRTMIISYIGLVLGYINKGVLFIIVLSTEEIGLINLVLSVGVLFAQFSNLGSSYTVWKFFPFFRNKNNNDYGFLTFNFLTVLSGLVFFSILAFLFRGQISDYYSLNSPEFVSKFFLIIPVGVGFGFFLLFDNYLRSLFKNTISVFINDIGVRVLNTIVIGLYAFDLISFNSLIYSICFTYMIPPVILFLYLRYLGEGALSIGHINIRKKFRRIIFSYSAYSYVNAMGGLVVVTLDAVMIASFLGLKETGVYTTIVYLTSALQIPYRSLIRVSSPIVAQHWKDKNMKAMSELYKRMSSVTLVVALSLFFAIWINRIELFGLLPDDFHEGIDVFLYLMIGKILDMYLGLNGTIFVTSKKYRYDILFTIFLMSTVYVLNFVLIPEWGIIGAAISTTIGYIGYNLSRLLFIWIAFGLNPFRMSQLKVFIVFIIIASTFVFININFDSVFFQMIIKWLIYGVLVFGAFVVLKVEPEISNYINKLKENFLHKSKGNG